LMVAGALFWVVRDEKRQVKRIRAE